VSELTWQQAPRQHRGWSPHPVQLGTTPQPPDRHPV